jgi:hypothetical protein
MAVLAIKKSVRDRLYLSLIRELCFWQHSFSAITGLPVLDYLYSSGSSGGYFDRLLTEDLAPAVFSLFCLNKLSTSSPSTLLFTCEL